MIELIAGIAYFIFVFFKAFQQRNVAWDHYWPILPISYMMSFSEVLVIAGVSVRTGMVLFEVVEGELIFVFELARLPELVPMMFAIGTGGGLGAMLGMLMHRKVFGRKK
jgi:hypothetical protein